MFTFGKVLRAGVFAAGMIAAATVQAQTVTLASALTNSQEVVAPGTMQPMTGATGFGTLTYNQTLGSILITLRVSGLSSPTVGVGPGNAPGHVHLGFPGENGGIVIPVTNAPVGQVAFDVTQSYTFAQLLGLGITQAGVTTLTNRLNAVVGAPQGTLAGLYFNVHTTNFPGGEIRGNLAVVPEPSTWALLGTGLAGVGAMARRRRQAA